MTEAERIRVSFENSFHICIIAFGFKLHEDVIDI